MNFNQYHLLHRDQQLAVSKTGPLNLITDIAGLRVGNTHDSRLRSGITAVLFDQPVVAAVDVRGGEPGSRETDLLAPENTVEAIDALVLSGGSAFGLDAAGFDSLRPLQDLSAMSGDGGYASKPLCAAVS